MITTHSGPRFCVEHFSDGSLLIRRKVDDAAAYFSPGRAATGVEVDMDHVINGAEKRHPGDTEAQSIEIDDWLAVFEPIMEEI